jgi:hypothetical protein
VSFESTLSYAFTYQTPARVLLGTIQGNRTITNIEIQITQAFSDSAAVLSLGSLDEPELLFGSHLSDLSMVTTYANPAQHTLNSQTSVYLTLDSGTSTTGSGHITVNFQ